MPGACAGTMGTPFCLVHGIAVEGVIDHSQHLRVQLTHRGRVPEEAAHGSHDRIHSPWPTHHFSATGGYLVRAIVLEPVDKATKIRSTLPPRLTN